MFCYYCKNKLKSDFTKASFDTIDGLLIIKNIPCYKCVKCEKIVYSKDTVIKLCDNFKELTKINSNLVICDYLTGLNETF